MKLFDESADETQQICIHSHIETILSSVCPFGDMRDRVRGHYMNMLLDRSFRIALSLADRVISFLDPANLVDSLCLNVMDSLRSLWERREMSPQQASVSIIFIVRCAENSGYTQELMKKGVVAAVLVRGALSEVCVQVRWRLLVWVLESTEHEDTLHTKALDEFFKLLHELPTIEQSHKDSVSLYDGMKVALLHTSELSRGELCSVLIEPLQCCARCLVESPIESRLSVPTRCLCVGLYVLSDSAYPSGTALHLLDSVMIIYSRTSRTVSPLLQSLSSSALKYISFCVSTAPIHVFHYSRFTPATLKRVIDDLSCPCHSADADGLWEGNIGCAHTILEALLQFTSKFNTQMLQHMHDVLNYADCCINSVCCLCGKSVQAYLQLTKSLMVKYSNKIISLSDTSSLWHVSMIGSCVVYLLRRVYICFNSACGDVVDAVEDALVASIQYFAAWGRNTTEFTNGDVLKYMCGIVYRILSSNTLRSVPSVQNILVPLLLEVVLCAQEFSSQFQNGEVSAEEMTSSHVFSVYTCREFHTAVARWMVRRPIDNSRGDINVALCARYVQVLLRWHGQWTQDVNSIPSIVSLECAEQIVLRVVNFINSDEFQIANIIDAFPSDTTALDIAVFISMCMDPDYADVIGIDTCLSLSQSGFSMLVSCLPNPIVSIPLMFRSPPPCIPLRSFLPSHIIVACTLLGYIPTGVMCGSIEHETERIMVYLQTCSSTSELCWCVISQCVARMDHSNQSFLSLHNVGVESVPSSEVDIFTVECLVWAALRVATSLCGNLLTCVQTDILNELCQCMHSCGLFVRYPWNDIAVTIAYFLSGSFLRSGHYSVILRGLCGLCGLCWEHLKRVEIATLELITTICEQIGVCVVHCSFHSVPMPDRLQFGQWADVCDSVLRQAKGMCGKSAFLVGVRVTCGAYFGSLSDINVIERVITADANMGTMFKSSDWDVLLCWLTSVCVAVTLCPNSLRKSAHAIMHRCVEIFALCQNESAFRYKSPVAAETVFKFMCLSFAARAIRLCVQHYPSSDISGSVWLVLIVSPRLEEGLTGTEGSYSFVLQALGNFASSEMYMLRGLLNSGNSRGEIIDEKESLGHYDLIPVMSSLVEMKESGGVEMEIKSFHTCIALFRLLHIVETRSFSSRLGVRSSRSANLL